MGIGLSFFKMSVLKPPPVVSQRIDLLASACTINAGRVFAELRLEFGKRTRTTSPQLTVGFGCIKVVINTHVRAIPIL
jgi:hypothetical protein